MKRYFLLIYALCTLFVGCRTIKEVQIVTDSVYITDTTTLTVHDTVKTKEIIHDSVDRRVEKIVYVDSNGVWHEKEKESLTHYIYQQSEEYKAKEAEYKSKISDLEKQLSEQQKVEYVEKPLRWWQKTLAWAGVVFILVVLGNVAYMVVSLRGRE